MVKFYLLSSDRDLVVLDFLLKSDVFIFHRRAKRINAD